MLSGSRRWSRRTRAPVVAVVAATVFGAFGSASASTLGGLTSGTLLSVNAAATGVAPAVLGCDNFALAASTGSALSNRPEQLPANCGAAVWATHLGTWTIVGGQLQAQTADATASMAAGATDVSAQTTVLNVNSGTTRTAGVAINHSGATRVYLAGVVVASNIAQLLLVNGGTVATIASAPVTVTTSTVVRLTRQGTAITMQVNGATVLTYTLTAAQVATLTGTRTGLYWGRGNAVRFTDFLVTQAAP